MQYMSFSLSLKGLLQFSNTLSQFISEKCLQKRNWVVCGFSSVSMLLNFIYISLSYGFLFYLVEGILANLPIPGWSIVFEQTKSFSFINRLSSFFCSSWQATHTFYQITYSFSSQFLELLSTAFLYSSIMLSFDSKPLILAYDSLDIISFSISQISSTSILFNQNNPTLTSDQRLIYSSCVQLLFLNCYHFFLRKFFLSLRMREHPLSKLRSMMRNSGSLLALLRIYAKSCMKWRFTLSGLNIYNGMVTTFITGSSFIQTLSYSSLQELSENYILFFCGAFFLPFFSFYITFLDAVAAFCAFFGICLSNLIPSSLRISRRIHHHLISSLGVDPSLYSPSLYSYKYKFNFIKYKLKLKINPHLQNGNKQDDSKFNLRIF